MLRQDALRLVAALFDRIAVTLQFDIDILFSEESRQLFYILARFVITFVGKRSASTPPRRLSNTPVFRVFGDFF